MQIEIERKQFSLGILKEFISRLEALLSCNRLLLFFSIRFLCGQSLCEGKTYLHFKGSSKQFFITRCRILLAVRGTIHSHAFRYNVLYFKSADISAIGMLQSNVHFPLSFLINFENNFSWFIIVLVHSNFACKNLWPLCVALYCQ